ncbi:MAG: GDSL-type esterase/lipase family protein [bacterium]|nr:GDSL-type esterase/lipase family protein [bacterium]
MKIKRILGSLTKIPFLCLLVVTLSFADGIDDSILPWPSPFHINPAHFVRPDDAAKAGTDSRMNGGTDGWNSGNAFQTSAQPHSDLSQAGNDLSVDDKEDAGAYRNTDTDAEYGTGTGTEYRGNNMDADGALAGGDGNAPADGAPANGDGGNAPDGDGIGMGNHTDGVPANGDGNAPTGGDGNAPDGDDGNSGGESGASGESGTDTPFPDLPVLGEDGLPLVQYMEVADDYFDDAVFIGDSRTRSLQLYANWEHTTFLADTGLTIYTVLDKKLTPSTMTVKTTVTDYLSSHEFNKIYLMLGINELGTGTAESFCKSYSEVLEQIRALQPDAIIYLQAILHISADKDREHTYINNAAIIERNEALRSLADNEHIFFLDSNPAVCDENGYLIDSYTFDGVHLQAKYVYLWTDYLKQHAILQEEPPVFQTPFPSPEPRAIQ